MAEGSKSFVEAVLAKGFALANRSTSADSFDRNFLFPKNYHEVLKAEGESKSFIRKSEVKEGKPAIMLSEEDINLLAESFQLALIGKFAHSRPKIDSIRSHFNKMNLAGKWNVGLLDNRHILMQFTSFEDYTLMFSKGSLLVGSSFCKVLKWTPDFDFSSEPSFAPVWIRLPGLKLHLFNKQILFSIAVALGRPLKLDSPTFNVSRPSIARILIEIDVSIPLPEELWIGSPTVGYWQKVESEFKPAYCTHCSKFGHVLDRCFHLNPQLARNKNSPKKVDIAIEEQEVKVADASVFENTNNSDQGTIHSENGDPVVVVPGSHKHPQEDQQEAIDDTVIELDAEIIDLVENSIIEAAEIILEDAANLVMTESVVEGESLFISNGNISCPGRSKSCEPPGSSGKLDGGILKPADVPESSTPKINFKSSELLPLEKDLEKVKKALEHEWEIQTGRRRKKKEMGKTARYVQNLPMRITRGALASPRSHP